MSYTDFTNDYNDPSLHFKEPPTTLEDINNDDIQKIYNKLQQPDLKTFFAYVGIAASISALATRCLDLLGKDYINLSAFFGPQWLMTNSSFLTGGLAFASYEIASSLTKPLLGRLSPLAGFAATIAFAHFTSVPIITVLFFTALGIITKNLISNIKRIQGSFHFVTSAATGGLIYEGSARLVTWLTGFHSLSLGWRHAAWAGVFGGGVTVVIVVGMLYLTIKLSKSIKLPKLIKYSLRIIVPIAASCYLSPVPVLVNVIMLGATGFTWLKADGLKFIPT